MKNDLLQVLLSNSLSLCLHVLNSSDLLLRVAPSGWNMMWYFSFKQSRHLHLHLRVMGLKSGARSTNFQLVSCFILSSFTLEYTRHIRQVCKVSIDLLTLAGLSTNISVDKPADPGRCMVKLQTCGP